MPKTQRHIFLLLFALLLASCKQKTVTQHDSQNDSVQKYLGLANSDTVTYRDRVKYNNKAYSFINLKRNDSLTRRYLQINILTDRFLYDVKKMPKKIEQLTFLSKQSNDNLMKAHCLKLTGLYYVITSKNEKALEYFFKAKKEYKKYDLEQYFDTISLIEDTQYYANDFLGSMNTSLNAISEITKSKLRKDELQRILAVYFFNVGDNLFELKQYNQALFYYNKVKKIEKDKSSVDIYIAKVYILKNQIEKANHHLDIAINDKNLLSEDPYTYIYGISLKSVVNFNNKKPKNVINSLIEVEKKLLKMNDVNFRNQNFKNLSICYAQAKDTINAIKTAKKAVALSKEYKNPNEILNCLTQLIKVDKKNAANHMKEYVRINDSMQIAERRFRDKFARIAFETDEITQQKDQAVTRSWIVAGSMLAVVLVSTLFLVLYYQRNKQKELVYQSSQEQANQEIYQLMLSQQAKEDKARQSEKKRIAQELHDGVMNKLASTRMNLSVLKDEKNPELLQQAQPFIDGIQAIEEEIRSIAQGLNHDMFLESNSFTRVLQDFVAQQNELKQAQYAVEIDPKIDWNTISQTIKMNVYRIIQEASYNANKFAEAQHVVISFLRDQNNLCFSILDDGKGFDTESTSSGIGIKNMKQRMQQLNGQLLIHSTMGKNTMISGIVPII